MKVFACKMNDFTVIYVSFGSFLHAEQTILLLFMWVYELLTNVFAVFYVGL